MAVKRGKEKKEKKPGLQETGIHERNRRFSKKKKEKGEKKKGGKEGRAPWRGFPHLDARVVKGRKLREPGHFRSTGLAGKGKKKKKKEEGKESRKEAWSPPPRARKKKKEKEEKKSGPASPPPPSA